MKKELICLLAFSLFSCSRDSENLPVPEKAELASVNVYKVSYEEITPDLTSFGSISFRSKADVTSTVDGTLVSLKVEEGDTVIKGETLAAMSNIQLQIREDQADSALMSALAALELSQTKLREGKMQIEARLLSIEKSELQILQKEKELAQLAKTLENKRELYSIGGITEEELTSLEINYSAAETNLLSLRKDISIQQVGLRDVDIQAYGYSIPESESERVRILKIINTRTLQAEVNVAESRVDSSRTELRSAQALNRELLLQAPISGIIGAQYLELGERVKADTKVFTVFDSTEVDISFPVPEAKGILLTRGLKVEAVVDSLDNRVFEAEIRQISPMVDPQSGNITIKAHLPNSEETFKPGMFTRVKVAYGETRNSIIIPETCIARKQNNNATLFLAVNNHVFRKEVELGEEKDGRIEVLRGLKENDLVIDSPSPLLREGEEINAKDS